MLLKSVDERIQEESKSAIFLQKIRGVYPSLPKNIQKAIDKFAARMDFEDKEILEINSLHNMKLDDTNDVEYEFNVIDTLKTIGNLNLKSSPDFKPSVDQIISMEDKFQQYTEVQNQVHFHRCLYLNA